MNMHLVQRDETAHGLAAYEEGRVDRLTRRNVLHKRVHVVHLAAQEECEIGGWDQ